ncbi:MAG: hypothetical protein JKY95_20150 [Planctomycetaceae bacterium]|nr:hypothetical protein [Planctomycetaceae bacterium]
MNLIGIDLGGANIKLTDLNHLATSLSFPLWKQKENLAETLRKLLSEYPRSDRIALTMTGELADCFSTKAEGVRYITQAVVEAAGETPVSVWQTAGEFVSPAIAIEFPLLTAAANWHALATWSARATAGSSGLLIDIGSTTADIIPLKQGVCASAGLTDFERLRAGELVYTGGRRTPLCAVARSVMLDGKEVPLAAELFATTQDIYQLLDLLPEQPDSFDTADGRPADIAHAYGRIAKMVCCDVHELGMDRIRNIAEQLAEHQLAMLKQATRQVIAQLSYQPEHIICSGSSEFLVKRLVKAIPALKDTAVISLSETVSPEIASAACAHAVTFLAYERC